MRPLSLIAGAFLFSFQTIGFSAETSLTSSDLQAQKFKKFIDLHFQKRPVRVSGDKLISTLFLQQFYEERGFKPAWNPDGKISEATLELLNSIQKADREGLNPDDYHLEAIKKIVAEGTRNKEIRLFNLELLLTDAFLTYGSHLLSGRINPYSIEEDWIANPRTGHLPTLLENAFETNNVRDMLKSLLPTQEYYAQMRIALDRYRTIQKNGGWDMIPAGPTVKLGGTDERIPALRERLTIEGDLRPSPFTSSVLDETLQRALISFQKRHGLDADGAFGAGTVKALNVSVEERVRQLRLNLERCRWMSANLGERHIMVNVADFTLDVIESSETVMTMKVVVGRRYRRTPVFSSTMTYLVLNPTWSVPRKIAGLDVLEHIREEPDYLKKNGFKVYQNYDDDAPEVDPATIDWSKLTLQTMEYRFKQAPGPQNALGRIKFIFPNKFDVYLHDTPSRELFQRTVRDFSSGCIRVEKPLELAAFLMQSNPVWSRPALETALQKKEEQYIQLAQPIVIHLMYWTAWADKRGNVQFREDIYGRDPALEAALRTPLEQHEN